MCGNSIVESAIGLTFNGILPRIAKKRRKTPAEYQSRLGLLDGTDVALGDNDGLRAACLAVLSLLQNSCTMFANENKLLHIFVKL